MTNLLLRAHVVVRNSSMNISLRHLTDCVKTWHKKHAARAEQLFFLIQPIKSLICGAFAFVVAVPVVVS